MDKRAAEVEAKGIKPEQIALQEYTDGPEFERFMLLQENLKDPDGYPLMKEIRVLDPERVHPFKKLTKE